MPNLPEYKKFPLMILILVFVLVGVVFLTEHFVPYSDTEDSISEIVSVESGELLENPFNTVKLLATAAVVYDTGTEEVIFERNAESQLPLASLTKLMTAVLAEEELPPNQIVRISRDALSTEGDSGFRNGERWLISELIDLTLLTSSNDGAEALASVIGSRNEYVEIMNQKSEKLGLAQTYFTNASGLDTSSLGSGSYGSAYDMARFFEYILDEHPTLLSATTEKVHTYYSLDGGVYQAENTNTELHTVPAIIASKTGFTDLAGGNLVVAYDLPFNRPVIVVVLGSTKEGRFTDVEQLAAAGRAYIGGEY